MYYAIYFVLSYYNRIKWNYVDLADAWREQSKELFLFQQKKTFFRFRSFYLETLVMCPLPFLAWRFFLLRSSLNLRSPFAAYLMSRFPSLYYDISSLFLALVPFSILCYFATLPIMFSGVSSPFSRTILSPFIPFACFPLYVRPHSSRMLLT